MIFADRVEAGRLLAEKVALELPGQDDRTAPRPLVLALPRGGVPVAAGVAERIGGSLDLVLARKIGAPGRPEFGVGAIAEDGPPVFDADSLQHLGITSADLRQTVADERAELARRAARYRGDRPPPDPSGRTVVLVDDGLATGITARAALQWLRLRRPHRLIMAVPVCAWQSREAVERETDGFVCLSMPPAFRAVGEWYTNFDQLTDEDVDAALSSHA